MKVKRTERGWVGHFICGDDCRFRRNTLLERGKTRIVVSSVGNMYAKRDGVEKPDTIGAFDRTYETMVFLARFEKPYWEAEVSQEVSFESPWSICINPPKHETDADANAMHETVVAEITKRLEAGEKFKRRKD